MLTLSLRISIIVFKLLRQIGNLICPFQSCFRDKKTMPMVTLGSYQIPVLLMPSLLEAHTRFLMYKRRRRTRYLTTKRRWDKWTPEAVHRTMMAIKKTNIQFPTLSPQYLRRAQQFDHATSIVHLHEQLSDTVN